MFSGKKDVAFSKYAKETTKKRKTKTKALMLVMIDVIKKYRRITILSKRKTRTIKS